ncbi:class I SAM-dependent methyltransferase [[Eubacterium] cellulosolvens]
MIKVKRDWWKDFFNHIYLITDSRSVCDPDLTAREVDVLEETLHLNKNDHILDLFGGQGRHSIELAKRGYQNLTVFDYSVYLITLGKKLARQENLKIKFVKGDSRTTGLKSGHYSNVIIMGNSFGYFPEERENLKVLKEAHRLLRTQGKLFIDMTDPEYVKKNLNPTSWHKIKDTYILRKREIKNNIIKSKEIVISQKDGLLRDESYCIRFYSQERIRQLLKKVGFRNILIQDKTSLHRKKLDYGLVTTRMFVQATK